MHNKTIQWIHEDIDGVIRPADKRRLDIILQNDPEAKKFWTELDELNRSLQGVSSKEPPARMKQRIMNAVGQSRTQTARPGRKTRLRMNLRYGYAFAMGAVVTLLVFTIFFGGDNPFTIPPSGDHVGAIGLNKYKTFPVIEKIRIRDSQISGTVFVREMNRIGGLEMYLRSSYPINVTVIYANDAVGFDMYKPLGGTAVTLKAGEGFVKVEGGLDDEYLLLFGAKEKKPAVLKLKIESRDEPVFTRLISLWENAGE